MQDFSHVTGCVSPSLPCCAGFLVAFLLAWLIMLALNARDSARCGRVQENTFFQSEDRWNAPLLPSWCQSLQQAEPGVERRAEGMSDQAHAIAHPDLPDSSPRYLLSPFALAQLTQLQGTWVQLVLTGLVLRG